jgi:nicotinamidase-related amidase
MGRLFDRDDCCLLVIDAQPAFYGDPQRVEPEALRGRLDRAAWLVGVARVFDVPVVVTEEDPERNGPTDPRIVADLPSGSPVFTKYVFGAADQPDILAAIQATGRRSAIVVGLETDVCVAQTALGLLDRDHRVAIVEDAVYAPGLAHADGIRRIAAAGGTIVHAKGIYYEWVRTLEAALAFERDHASLADPPGFDL